MMNWYWGGGWLGMSAMVLGWVALFTLAVWLVTRVTRTEHPISPGQAFRVWRDLRRGIRADAAHTDARPGSDHVTHGPGRP